MTKTNLKTAPKTTVGDVIASNVDFLKSASVNVAVTSGSITVRLTDDEKLPAVFAALPRQAQKILKFIGDHLVDGVCELTPELRSELDEYVIHKSEENAVVTTYLGLLLGNPWGPRLSKKLRKAQDGDHFACLTRV